MTGPERTEVPDNTCPHCRSDLTGSWMSLSASWDAAGNYECEITCPECGEDVTEAPRAIDFGGSDSTALQSSTTLPPEIEGNVTIETFELVSETFNLEPPLWTTRQGIEGPIRSLPPADTARWQLSDVTRERTTVLADGLLPLEADFDGIPVELDQTSDGPVTLTLNGDSTFTLSSPQQLPFILYDRIHVQRLGD